MADNLDPSSPSSAFPVGLESLNDSQSKMLNELKDIKRVLRGGGNGSVDNTTLDIIKARDLVQNKKADLELRKEELQLKKDQNALDAKGKKQLDSLIKTLETFDETIEAENLLREKQYKKELERQKTLDEIDKRDRQKRILGAKTKEERDQIDKEEMFIRKKIVASLREEDKLHDQDMHDSGTDRKKLIGGDIDHIMKGLGLKDTLNTFGSLIGGKFGGELKKVADYGENKLEDAKLYENFAIEDLKLRKSIKTRSVRASFDKSINTEHVNDAVVHKNGKIIKPSDDDHIFMAKSLGILSGKKNKLGPKESDLVNLAPEWTMGALYLGTKLDKYFGGDKKQESSSGGGGLLGGLLGAGLKGLGGGLAGLGQGIGKGLGGILSGIGSGLRGLALGLAAFSTPPVMIGTGIVTGALVVGMLALGEALNLAAPALHELQPVLLKFVEMVGGVFVKAIEKLPNIITSVGNSIATVVNSISKGAKEILGTIFDGIGKMANLDPVKLVAAAGGITAIGLAIAGFGGGSAVGAAGNMIGGALEGLGNLFSGSKNGGGPADKFEKFAQMGPGLKAAGDGLGALVGAIAAMNGLDMNKASKNIELLGNAFAKSGMATALGGMIGSAQATYANQTSPSMTVKDLYIAEDGTRIQKDPKDKMLFVQDLNTVEVVKSNNESSKSEVSMGTVEKLLYEILTTLQESGRDGFSDPLKNKSLLIGR